MTYNPNDKFFGWKEVDFDNLCLQASVNPELFEIFLSLKNQNNSPVNPERAKDLIDQLIRFSSPFEKS